MRNGRIPAGTPAISAFLAYQQTLAYFDEQVAAEPELFNYKAEGGKARTLLHILQAKDRQYLRDEEQRLTHGHQTADETAEVATDRETSDDPAAATSGVADKGTADGGNGGAEGLAAGVEAERTPLDWWRTRVGNADRRLEHPRRWFRLRMRTSPGLALRDLQAARDALQPPLSLVGPDDKPVVRLSEMLKLVSSSDYPLLKVADGDRFDDTERELIAERVTHLRAGAELLHEDLRRRIAATRSRLALVHRFKLRCEWHDRERMRAVADDKSLSDDRIRLYFAGCRTIASATTRSSGARCVPTSPCTLRSSPRRSRDATWLVDESDRADLPRQGRTANMSANGQAVGLRDRSRALEHRLGSGSKGTSENVSPI